MSFYLLLVILRFGGAEAVCYLQNSESDATTMFSLVSLAHIMRTLE